MTLLTRWDPFREYVTLQNRMNNLFRDPRAQEGQDESLTTTAFAPPVDVYEDEHNVTLKIEVPGIDEKDIDVRIENNTLTVHGERKFEKEEKEENYRRVERHYGTFTRTFTLPNTVDLESVQADYDKGVLQIKLAKKAEAKPKQIKVNVSSQKTLDGKQPESKQPKSASQAA
ncbi:MAG: Hsp20/alpha crystallin family protein [Terriglobales bacterium]